MLLFFCYSRDNLKEIHINFVLLNLNIYAKVAYVNSHHCNILATMI